MGKVYFISGIDTGIGKTIATGFLAKKYLNEKKSVITQKLVQTGCQNISDDILKHREIMGISLTNYDVNYYTMPEIFNYPASPHLATKIDKKNLDLNKILQATNFLTNRFDVVLLEGAGGLMVPLTEYYLTIDYIKDHQYEVILVTSGRLGSINHTLLSLELLKNRNIDLKALIFNHYDDIEDIIIAKDTYYFLRKKLIDYYPNADFISLEKYDTLNK